MTPHNIILKHYGPDTQGENAYEILLEHSRLVANKAAQIARGLDLDEKAITFVHEGALLHDIGIFMTNAHGLGCFGDKPYIMHGVIGRKLLEAEGLLRHARVCETHVGVGITKDEIMDSGLPLPKRDMIPQSIEEKIICVADKFFRKGADNRHTELGLDEARSSIKRYGSGQINRFDTWIEELGITG